MIYQKVLKNGHLNDFLNFLRERGEMASNEKGIIESWMAANHSDPATGLRLLCDDNEQKLLELVEIYFRELGAKKRKDLCLRCNREYASYTNDPCQICSWGGLLDLNSISRANSDRINQEILYLVVDFLKLQETEKSYRRTNQNLEEEHQNILIEIERILSRQKELTTLRESKEKERVSLKDRRVEAERKIAESQKRYLNKTPLIRQYIVDEHDRKIINLKFSGPRILSATVDKDIDFPVELLLGIHEKKKNRYISNAAQASSFFLRLNRERWKRKKVINDVQYWEADLKPLLLNHFQQKYVVNYFSVIPESEGYLQINYTERHNL